MSALPVVVIPVPAEVAKELPVTQLQPLDSAQSEADGWVRFGLEVTKIVITVSFTIFLGYQIQKVVGVLIGGSLEDSAAAQAAKKSLAKRLKRPEVEEMSFDPYEMKLISEILGPDEINVSFQDVGGMDEQLEEVTDNVVLPMQLWSKYRRIGVGSADDMGLSSCPTGVLLYGMPGTGKSLTAKAIAKESGATFLNIKASSIMDKYVGESDKTVSAIFRLGRKLAPTVIFIDEIDTVLRKRGGFDNSAVQSMQGVFLAEWDGLNAENRDSTPDTRASTANNLGMNGKFEAAGPQTAPEGPSAPVVVLGATNRPTDLDQAFLRRMPVQIQTFMPDLNARVSIFRAQLKSDLLSEDVDLSELAAATENFSGSDIRELIRVAKQQRAKGLLLSAKESASMMSDAGNSKDSGVKGKALGRENFWYALHKVASTVSKTSRYGKKQAATELMEKYAGMIQVTE